MTTDTDDETTVYVTQGGNVCHTTPDCRALEKAGHVKSGPRWYYDHRDVCSYCADTHTVNGRGPGALWEDATGEKMVRRTPESTGVTQTPTPGRPDPDTCPWPDCSGPVRGRTGNRSKRCYVCNRRPEDSPDPETTDRPMWALP